MKNACRTLCRVFLFGWGVTWGFGTSAAGDQVVAPSLGPTLTRIAGAGVVKVGYIPTPGTFAFQDGKGETVGYSIELCQRVIERVKRTLNRPDLRTQFRPVQAAQRIPLLKTGEIDIECGANTNTAARQHDVDFSYTFFNTGVRFLVLKPLDAGNLSNLSQKRVAVTQGTTAQEIVAKLANERGVIPVAVNSDEEGVRMVESGEAAAFAQDDILLYGLAASAKKKDDLVVSGKFLSVEPYAFMLPKGDTGFREIVDKALLSLMHSGEIVAIYDKWFDNGRMQIPMNIYMKENIRFPSRYGIP
jgi:glutamate/aspartate transport system substrate-binding protein